MYMKGLAECLSQVSHHAGHKEEKNYEPITALWSHRIKWKKLIQISKGMHNQLLQYRNESHSSSVPSLID